MTRADDLWCDWCGRRNQVIYRHDDRVFCGFACIRRYQAPIREPSEFDPDVEENRWEEGVFGASPG